MPKTILLADDCQPVRRVVREILECAGYDVCAEAVDGVDALEKADRFSPDLLILDLVMPSLNGFEVIAALKRTSPRTPIVVFTLYDGVAVPLPGAAAVLLKVDGADALLACVNRLLSPEPASSAALEPSPVPA